MTWLLKVFDEELHFSPDSPVFPTWARKIEARGRYRV